MNSVFFCKDCNISDKDVYHVVESCANQIFKELGYGLGESIYQNALAASLRKQLNETLKCSHAKKSVEQETTIPIYCDSFNCGTMRSDIILYWSVGQEIQKNIIIELKSTCTNLDEKSVLQLLAYLRATNTSRGILLNFTQKSNLLESILTKKPKKRKTLEEVEPKREISISLEELAKEPNVEFLQVFLK